MVGYIFKQALSEFGSETDRAVKTRALSAGIKAIINVRRVCKILVVLAVATVLFSISAFQLIDTAYTSISTGIELSASLIFYGSVAVINLAIILLFFSERLWVKALNLDQIIAHTTEGR